MKPASTQQIKEELRSLSQKEVTDLCLRLIRSKKENKELLSYILFDSADRQNYVATIKNEMDDAFAALPSNRYFIKKGLRDMLKNITRYSRYMGEKEPEVELRLHFCQKMKLYGLASHKHQSTISIYTTQLDKIQGMNPQLHEDLQYDFQKAFNEMID